uniref:RING-type domain-containing protein n=1 Tax=Clastoptera arizonana TaxID=38151 RepID=A0A1B6C990_9HEMI
MLQISHFFIGTERKAVNLKIDSSLVDPSDFDCVLCCRTIWKPVTTPCGHSYCSMCLDRCLDYSSACPLCMKSLSNYLGTSEKRVTQFLEDALKIGLPSIYTSRLLLHHQELIDLERSPEVPIFVCTTAFPSVPCPLFVYEPRYRLMIRRAVESGTGQFAMAACLKESNDKSYADYGTMLKIEDWLLMGDGCSILTTVGMRRFHVISRGEKDGYDTAQIQLISDTPVKDENLKELKVLHNQVLSKGKRWFSKMLPSIQEEIWKTFGHMPEPEENWYCLPDGPSWLWWLLAILPLGKQLQIGLLSITCLVKRLHAIDKTLDHIARNAEATKPLRPQQSSSKHGSGPS